MVWNKVLFCAFVLLLMEDTKANTYTLENCNFAGFLPVPESGSVTVTGGQGANTNNGDCELLFRASNPEHTLTVALNVLNILDCDMALTFRYGTEGERISCGFVNPGELYTHSRELAVSFTRGTSGVSYQIEFVLTSSKPVPVVPGAESSANEVGLILGIVGGVFTLLLFAVVLGVCCHRRARKAKVLYRASQFSRPQGENGKPYDGHASNGAPDVPYPHESSPRAKTKLLSETESSSSPRANRPKTLNFHSNTKPGSEDTSSKRPNKANMDFEDDDETYDKTEDMKRPPKSPFLSALQSNSKFKASNAANNKDAEERAKRISSTSSLEASSSASRDTPPTLPAVPVAKSPGTKRKNHASIRRAYRTASSSEEEFNQIAAMSVQKDNSGSSSSEIATSKSQAPLRANNTQHSLKPDKNKNKKVNKKDMKLQDYEPTSGNFQKNTARASKRAQKSPRLGSRSDGFSHRRTRSDARSEGEDSRPGTPTSINDLESLPPLQRSASRQSLYASRSSLYRRRGRRDSYAESVASTYVRDDMEIGRHSRSYSQNYYDDDETDGYERPISRRERERIFRSTGDIGRDTKERSTQTLRETATQTGLEQSVIMQPKRVVKKKKRSRSVSAVGTQTVKETKKKEKPNSKKVETEKPSDEDNLEKPVPKPKPKPRKSLNSVGGVSTVEDSDDGKKKKRKKKRAQSKEDISQVDQPAPDSDQPGPSVLQSQPVMASQVPGQPFVQYNMPPGTLENQVLPAGYQMAAPGMAIQSQPVIYPGGAMPFGSIPQGGYMVQPQPQQQMPRPPQPAHIPGKPRKSNWDMLCSLTEGDYQQKQAAMTETGSIASSVFTNNLPSHVGHPGLGNQAYSNVAFTPPMVGVPQTETLPRVPPTYTEAIHMDAVSGPYSSSQSGSETGVVINHNDQTNLLPKKSSWEVLKEITDNQKSESVV